MSVRRPLPHPDVFWTRVDTARDDGCWEWQGYRDRNGYGILVHHGRHWRAHRAALALDAGDIPPGLHVLHTCDNPPCCRPDHLRLGTPADNASDRITRHRDAELEHARLAAAGQMRLPIDQG